MGLVLAAPTAAGDRFAASAEGVRAAEAIDFAVDEVRTRRGEPGRDEPKAQPVVEPEARVTLRPLRLALGDIVPVGGRLGGREPHAGGVRFALGAEIGAARGGLRGHPACSHRAQEKRRVRRFLDLVRRPV